MTKEVMKEAIQVLKKLVVGSEYEDAVEAEETIKALEEALKQEQDEPVGKFAKFNDGIWREVTVGSSGVLLYTHPKEWEGLTDEQREDIWDEVVNTHGFAGDESEYMVDLVITATEAKLKEKNYVVSGQ